MLSKTFYAILLSFILFTSCKDESTSPTGDCERIGAVCNDGTRSSATGSGACSHHGGVKEWICK